VTDDIEWELQALGRLADGVPLAPAPELRRRGDRRTRARRIAWAGVASIVLICAGLTAGLTLGGSPRHRVVVGGSTSPTSAHVTFGSPVNLNPSTPGSLLPRGTIVDGRVLRPIIIDGGALRIDPAPSTLSATFTLEQARSVVKAAQTHDQGTVLQSTASQADVGFGVVDLADKLSVGLPAYSDRPAWVAILKPRSATMYCPPTSASSTSGSATPVVDVVLLDAQTGTDVLDYRSRGSGPCGGQITGPSIQRAQEIISIPWISVGESPLTQKQVQQFPPNANLSNSAVNWTIQYTVPRCATIFDSPGIYEPTGPNNPVLYVDAQRPITPPSSCPPARTVTNTFGPETTSLSQAKHGPTGLAAGPEI
jgi:hypothetical protein